MQTLGKILGYLFSGEEKLPLFESQIGDIPNSMIEHIIVTMMHEKDSQITGYMFLRNKELVQAEV